jgi:hypothetical protein
MALDRGDRTIQMYVLLENNSLPINQSQRGGPTYYSTASVCAPAFLEATRDQETIISSLILPYLVDCGSLLLSLCGLLSGRVCHFTFFLTTTLVVFYTVNMPCSIPLVGVFSLDVSLFLLQSRPTLGHDRTHRITRLESSCLIVDRWGGALVRGAPQAPSNLAP